ncbi:M15 family metallopeptidase [Nitratifractor sp.]
MKKKLRYSLFLPFLLLLPAGLQAKCDSNARRLVNAYPQLSACRNNRIVWKDGTTMLYDDGRRKTFTQRLKKPDIQDMFHDRYPKSFSIPQKDFDPGRYRYEPFFRHMYGNSPEEVRRHLTTIDWFGQKIRVTRVNNVDRQLRAVERDLKRLLKKKPGYRKYLTPIGGTFKWRKIAGTNRLSVHSFGAAIDINVKHSAYWRWNKGAYRYRNQIPHEIVRIFEKHGFIWGGKWFHYDTMHFEYRPELPGMGKGSSHSAASKLRKGRQESMDCF